MSSKTILIGLSIFRCGVEKSVHGRPSWELAPYDCSLQNTKDFTAWCKLVSRKCKFNDRAGECGVVRYTTQFFVLDKAKALPIRIGSQTAWDAVRLDFIDNKEKVTTKDYKLHGRCDFLVLCTVILHFSQSPIVTIVVRAFQKPKTNQRILPFVTQYQPSVLNLKQILKKNWHLIEQQPLLSEIYKKPPLVSYKRGRLLKDILVRAKL